MKISTEPDAERQAFFDAVRVALTALVLLHHAASVYGGAGDWYWREQASSSSTALVAFNAINQSYFMGFFFLISGYFSAASLERRGNVGFLRERLLRLGLPLAIYFFCISPLTVSLAAAANGEAFWATFRGTFKSAQLEPGPLWFVQSLLLFALCYVAWAKLFPRGLNLQALPSTLRLVLAGIIIGLVSFTVRLWLPVGESVIWLQLGYFPLYIVFYFSGCAAYRAKLLGAITLKQALPPAALSVLALLSLPSVMAGTLGSGEFEGGVNLNAFYYALWDPVVAFGVILTMLWLFRVLFNERGPITQFLGRRAYAMYIVHPPVLVVVSVLLSNWLAHPVAKTAVLGLVAWLACVAIASFLLLFTPVRRVL